MRSFAARLLGPLGLALAACAAEPTGVTAAVTPWAADAPIGALSTYRVGGTARWLVVAHRIEDLHEVVARRGDHPVLVVGKGSNLLVGDAGFDGIAVQLGEAFAEIEVLGAAETGGSDAGDATEPAAAAGVIVRAGAAASLPVVARRSRAFAR